MAKSSKTSQTITADQWKKLRDSGMSGSDIHGAVANGSLNRNNASTYKPTGSSGGSGGSGNAKVDQYTTDKTPTSVASAAGRAANGIGNSNVGSFEDYQSYIRKGGAYVPKGLRESSAINFGNGKPADTSAADKQGWDNIQNLAGMSTDQIMQYYMDHPEANFDKDMSGAEAYFSSQYNNALNDSNSDYAKDVSNRKNEWLKNPENLYQFAMEEGKKNNWTDNEYVEFFDIMSKLQEPDYLGRTTDYYQGFDNYSARKQQENVDALFGGPASNANLINESAVDIMQKIMSGDYDTQDDVYNDIFKLQRDNKLSEDDMNSFYSVLNQYLDEYGQGLDKRMAPTINDPNASKNEVQSIIDNASQEVAKYDAKFEKQVLDSGKYGTDTESPMFKGAVRKLQDEEIAKGGDYAQYKSVIEEGNQVIVDIDNKAGYAENEKQVEETLGDQDVSRNATTVLQENLEELEASSSPQLRNIFNNYVAYLKDNNPEMYAKYASGNVNEFTGELEIPRLDDLARDSGFMTWYEQNALHNGDAGRRPNMYPDSDLAWVYYNNSPVIGNAQSSPLSYYTLR